MLTIEVVQLNTARALLERVVGEQRGREDRDLTRTLDLLYGAEPTATDLGVIARASSLIERSLSTEPTGANKNDRGNSTVQEFLRALSRYLPDRIVISVRGEAPWFVFELPQAAITVGGLPRTPPPHQWFIHTERVNAILKTYSAAPTLDQVRAEARMWLNSDAYRIRLAATP